MTEPQSFSSQPSSYLDARVADVCQRVGSAHRLFFLKIVESLHGHLPTGESVLDHALGTAKLMLALGHDWLTCAAALLEPLISLSPQGLDPLLQTLLQDLDSCNKSDESSYDNAIRSDFERLLQGILCMERLHPLAHRGAQCASLKDFSSESLRKMLLAMVEDIRVVIIRLSSRLQTLRYLTSHDISERVLFAQETLTIYAPLANRLGVWTLKWELEDLSFRFLEPVLYKSIAKLLDEKRVEREAFIQRVMDQLAFEIKKTGITCEVQGRAKHIYSIYNKMQHKQLSFEQLFDIRAVRVLVPHVQDCYLVLGVVHNLWLPIPKEFDDYILQPKDNLYQSLHTVVSYPGTGKIIEVQIRTYEMNQYAEFGLAAHWRYKEKGNQDEAYGEKIALLRQLMLWKEDVSAPSTTMSPDWSAKTREVGLDDTVYVMTPDFRVIDLPQGATPLDFAYKVHTYLGHRCRGAHVNDRLVSLDYTLKTGDRVTIITCKEGGPSRDWINSDHHFLRTSYAKKKVRSYFVRQENQAIQSAGRDLLVKELARANVSDLSYAQLADQFGFEEVERWFAAIGRGDITATQIRRAIRPVTEKKIVADHPRTDAILQGGKNNSEDQILVVGVDRIPTHLAGCCRPVPGDIIAGFVTTHQGISIHRLACSCYAKMVARYPERLMEATWAQAPIDMTKHYHVELRIKMKEEQYDLHPLLHTLVEEKVGLVRLALSARRHEVTMVIVIDPTQKIAAIIEKLRLLPLVAAVRR